MIGRDNIKNVERARLYADAVRNSHYINVESSEILPGIKLPVFYDSERVKNARAFFRCNYYAMMFSMYMGLLAILAVPSILNVLVHTKKSSSNVTAYKRYMQTIYHTLTWFRSDLQPGTKAWNSILAVRKFHFTASKAASSANVGIISQRDMVITQYGFMGFAVLSKEQAGVQGTSKSYEDFCHLWRVIGNMMGIKDELNMCCENLDETLERIEVIRSEFLLPYFQEPPEDFKQMTKYIVNALSCFDPFDTYNEIIFMAKRLVGVPGYHYFETEVPEGYNREHLQIYKYYRWDRVQIWFSVMTRQFATKSWILRWILNFSTFIGEFFIRFFPALAFFKFGFRNAYVHM